MLTHVQIENLRGIAAGSLSALTPLTVLTGPNGSGKSTVLDAMLIGLNPVGDSVGRVIRRRAALWSGAKWLFYRPHENKRARIEVGENPELTVDLQLNDEAPQFLTGRLSGRPGPFTAIEAFVAVPLPEGPPQEAWSYVTAFAADNYYAFSSFDHEVVGLPMNEDDEPHEADEPSVGEGSLRRSRARLVDPATPTPLDQVFTAASQAGRRRWVRDLLAEVTPGLSDIVLLTDAGGRPVLHLEFEGIAVPIAVAGDGIQVAGRLALELAARPAGTVLIEEPEVHLHPAAMGPVATILWSSVERGIQVVLATHSLEFIDELLAAAPEEQLQSLSLHNLRLEAGQLRVSSTPGPDVQFARDQIEADLR